MKYHIVGIHKCGTTSLMKWLIDKGHEVIRNEFVFWEKHGPRWHLHNYSEYTPILLLRDPIERIWSHYNYKRFKQPNDINEIHCSFEEALTTHPEMLWSSDYDRWIKHWEPTKPVIMWLEELQKDPTFPKENTTEKEPMTDTQRQLATLALNMAKEHRF